jgi:hypothetical protein
MSKHTHSWKRIRHGLYNYRAYNIKKFRKGWAVRDENGNPWHSPCDTLRGVCGMIDTMYLNEYIEQARRATP